MIVPKKWSRFLKNKNLSLPSIEILQKNRKILKGYKGVFIYRLRDKYRVFYKKDKNNIEVCKIGNRDKIYN